MVNRSRVKSGQESVWDYPRPPQRARRVLETSHPPVYYVLPEDVRMEHLTPSDAASLCEWKGPGPVPRYRHRRTRRAAGGVVLSRSHTPFQGRTR